MVVLGAFGQGVLFGLLLALLIGPVFFALIQTSIEKGFASGAGMALGIALSDSMYVLIASFGVAMMANSLDFQIGLGLIGGIIMLLFGFVNLFKKVKGQNAGAESGEPTNLMKQMVKGFLLNGVNPFVLLFWIGIATMVNLTYQYPVDLQIVFFCAIILTVLLLDLVKAYAANKLRNLLTPRFLTWMNRIVGIVLIMSSFRLFYFSIEAMGLCCEFAIW